MLTNTQAEVLIINTKRICIEAMTPILGETAAIAAFESPAAGSLAEKINTLKATYDASPATFVATQTNIDNLDAALDQYQTLSFDPIDDITDAMTELTASVTPTP